MQKNNMDLGTGKIGRLMLSLAAPAIAAQVVNMLYNIVDRIYIGHIKDIGAVALTGVGLTFPIIILIMAFAGLIGMGGAPRAAIKMGQGEDKEAEKILGNCFVALLFISVILTVIFTIYGEKMLWLFGASEDTIQYAKDYMQIYVFGTIFVQIALGLNSFINTQGFAKIGMATVLIGAVINIALDPLFIFTFNMGVKGAALATIISQGVSAVWVLIFLFGKKTKLKIKKEDMRIRLGVIGPVLALGISPFVMQATESLLSISLNSSLQKYGGDVAVGAYTIIASVMQIINLPLMGLSQGAQPIISYNYGAMQFERVRKAIRLLLTCSITYSTLFWLAIMLIPQIFVSLFNDDPALMDQTVWAIRIFLGGVIASGFQTGCQQSFLALGQAKVSLLLALLRKIILLIPLIYILPCILADQLFAVFLAEPIADLTAAVVTTISFLLWCRKNLKGRQDMAQNN